MQSKTALLVTSALTLLCLRVAASPRDSFSITNGWKATYSSAITECPDDAAWGVYPSPNGHPWWSSVDFSKTEAKPEGNPDLHNGMWLETTTTIPAEWAGRRIHFDLPVPIRRCDAVLFLNGKRVGDILRPGGALELTELVVPGESCTLTLFLTQDGVGTERGETRVNRWDNGLARGLMYFPQLIATDAAFVTDVFANPSVQKKSFTLEMEVDSAAAMPATLHARILDAEGTVVKTFTESVQLQKGINTFKPTQEWENPHFWDFGDGYLYRCEVSLTADKVADDYKPFTFGFRELWREGRELYMNGRPLHMRTCYAYQASSVHAMEHLRHVGYNVLAYSHEMHGFPNSPLTSPIFENADTVGMGVIVSSGALLGITNDTLPDNPAEQEIYRNYVQHFHRKYRNHPSLVASYVCQMIICNIADFVPNRIGQTVGEAQRDKAINTAREIQREFNPNILYYSHADGPNGDLSSGNLYFNWTPQQEVDEWFSEWSKKGIYPWHGAEFELPYGGALWYGGGYAASEFFASFYGERAFEEETLRMLDSTQELSANNRSGHQGNARSYRHYTDPSIYWKWRKMAVQNIQCYWRGYGLNGGLIWFNLDEAYGVPENALGQREHYATSALRDGVGDDFVPGQRPRWANQAYDIHQPVNQDFLGYLAGTPDIADKTHAFYAGETIAKQAAFIWDGPSPKEFSATWSVALDGTEKPFASGSLVRTMKPGEIAFEPISFEAPAVTQKTSGTLTLAYSDGTSTELALEFYPRPNAAFEMPANTSLALFDPIGEDAALLTTLGIPFTRIDAIDAPTEATHLIMGRNALTKVNLATTPEALANGAKLLIMPQTPTVWRSLGFEVKDIMARTVFVRDRQSPALAPLTEDMLAYWRGAPDYGLPPYTRVMSHSAQRGPQGTLRHIVAGLLLQVPEKAGYLPLIDGGYDLNFAALLRFISGTGSLTLCTLELEHRVGSDPAATEVARAVFSDFLTHAPNAASALAAHGAAASELLQNLGFMTAESAADAAILVAGPDATTDWPTLRDAAEAGATVLIYANTALAQAAGFSTEPRQIYRTKIDTSLPLFRTFTPSLTRWRDVLKADAFTFGPDTATFHADGLIATLPLGKGRVVFSQIDPLQLSQRFAANLDETALQADQKWMFSLFCGILETLGAPAKDSDAPAQGRGVRWNHWDAEGRSLVEQSGVNRDGRSGNILVAGVHKNRNTLPFLRQQAEQGQTVLVVDDVLLADAAGFVVGPRELISELDPALFGLTTPDAPHPFALDRSVRRLLSAPDGFTISANGLMAEATIGEGRLVFLQLNPLEFEKLGQDIDRIRNSNDISAERARQFYARLLTNLGGAPSTQIAARALHISPLNPLTPLPTGYVLGPFVTNKDDGDYHLNTVYSEEAEKLTREGDFNPNIDFPLPQGGTANWRTTLAPDADGLYDFQKLWPSANFPITYVITHVNRNQAGPATLKIGVDYHVIVWCNGKEVFRTTAGAHYPKFEIPIELNKGDNVISFKVGAGRAGNKLWGLITAEPDPDATPRIPIPELDDLKLYSPTRTRTDPYQFIYW